MNIHVNEVTGCPGSGKTYGFSNSFAIGYLAFFLVFPLVFLYLLVFKSNIIRYIFSRAYGLRRSYWNKIAFVFFAFYKLCNFYAAIFNFNSLTVDEGISHLPFNLELTNEKDFKLFCDLFNSFLTRISVTLVTVSTITISKRILSRGHKRVLEEASLESFVAVNKLVEYNMIRILPKYVYKFQVINSDTL